MGEASGVKPPPTKPVQKVVHRHVPDRKVRMHPAFMLSHLFRCSNDGLRFNPAVTCESDHQ